MKTIALILLLFPLWVSPAGAAPDAANELFATAQKAAAEKRFDDAIQAYESILTEHPEAMSRWFSAQSGIAQMLAKKGDLAEAVKAARLCLDSAPTLQNYNEAIGLTANILSALDKNVDRANAFIAFQQTGPAPGVTNPIEAIPYPSLPAREAAFAVLRQNAGDDAAASRLRAFTYLLTGKPKEALAQFADAFRRSSTPQNIQRSGADLVLTGLRAVRGHAFGLDKALAFVVSGPEGAGGNTNAGGVADPFEGLLPPAPAPGEGGLDGAGPDDLAALRRVHDAAKLYLGDRWVPEMVRRSALGALHRSNDALDGWGEAGQKDWYLDLAFNSGFKERWAGEVIDDGVVASTEAAAKGRALHLGGVSALWKEIDAYYAAHQLAPGKGMESIRNQFKATLAALAGMQFPKSTTSKLKSPASF